MPEEKLSHISRRGFIRQAPAAVLAAGAASVVAAETPAPQASQPLPRRVLGRTNLQVTCMTLGTAPCGFALAITPPQVGEIVKNALDLGVNYVDTAPGYGNAEEGIGPAATFWMYAVACVAAFLFISFFIPETKGKTLEEIERGWKRK